MRYSFWPVTYYGMMALIGCILCGLITTVAVTFGINKRLEVFDTKIRGLEKNITTIAVTDADLTKPWKPMTVQIETPAPPVMITDTYPRQFPGAPTPDQSAKAADLQLNLLYALKYYGQPPAEAQGTILTSEYVRETGAGRIAQLPDWEIYTDLLSYLASLEIQHKLAPDNALFDKERTDMHAKVAPAILANLLPPDQVMALPGSIPDEPYWLAREVATISGDTQYDVVADKYAEGIMFQVRGLNGLIANNAPGTVYATNLALPAMAYDMGKRHSDPELVRMADDLMRYLLANLYDPKTKTILNDYGSQTGEGSDTREGADQIAAITGIWRYVRLTNDAASR
ncbi:MAG: hypothetical protein ABI743_08895, partial [bacterium]